MNQKPEYPCRGCTRVEEPTKCENKQCRPWRCWFFSRWEQIHGYYTEVSREENYELEK